MEHAKVCNCCGTPIWYTNFRYQTNDQEFLQLLHLHDSGHDALSRSLPLNFLPFVEYWPLKWLPQMRKTLYHLGKIKAFCGWKLYEHKKGYEKGKPLCVYSIQGANEFICFTDVIHNFYDALLHERAGLKQLGDDLEDHNMVWIIVDLFLGKAERCSQKVYFIHS